MCIQLQSEGVIKHVDSRRSHPPSTLHDTSQGAVLGATWSDHVYCTCAVWELVTSPAKCAQRRASTVTYMCVTRQIFVPQRTQTRPEMKV